MAEQNKMPETLPELLRWMKEENIPENQRKSTMLRYLSMKCRDKAIPFSGTFELTPLCNLDCKMCYVHLNRDQMEGKALLPVERWKEIIRDAHDAGMRLAKLTGGECLTYPGFDEIYLYLQSMGIEVQVLTNGILLDRERIAFLKEHPVCFLQVTLYGSSNDAYEKVTGHRQFDRVWENIALAKEAKLPLHLAITPSAFMEEDAEELLRKVYATGLTYSINSGLFDPRESTGRNGKPLDASLNTYIRMYALDHRLRNIVLTPCDKKDLPEENRSGKPVKGIRCGAGRSTFTIDWQGSMYACTNIQTIYEDLSEVSFIDAWTKVNRSVTELDIPAECEGCAYRSVCVPCAGAHMQDGSSAHCNTSFCKRAKLLVMTGIKKLPEDFC